MTNRHREEHAYIEGRLREHYRPEPELLVHIVHEHVYGHSLADFGDATMFHVLIDWHDRLHGSQVFSDETLGEDLVETLQRWRGRNAEWDAVQQIEEEVKGQGLTVFHRYDVLGYSGGGKVAHHPRPSWNPKRIEYPADSQCDVTTKSGDRCSRNANIAWDGLKVCSQHQRQGSIVVEVPEEEQTTPDNYTETRLGENAAELLSEWTEQKRLREEHLGKLRT
jgi:hypothetical protein